MKNFEAQQYRENLAGTIKSTRNEGDEGREKAHEILEEAQKTFEYKMAKREMDKGRMENYYLGDLEFFMSKENIEAIENYVEKEISPFVDKWVENAMTQKEEYDKFVQEGTMEQRPFNVDHKWEKIKPSYCSEDHAYCETFIDNKRSGINGYFKHDDVPRYKLTFNKETEEVEFFTGDAEMPGYMPMDHVENRSGLGATVARLGEELLKLSNQDIVVFNKKFAFRRNKVEYKDYKTEKFTGEIKREVELTRNMNEVTEELLSKKKDIDRILENIK